MRHRRKLGRTPPFAWTVGAITTVAVAASVVALLIGGDQDPAPVATTAAPVTAPLTPGPATAAGPTTGAPPSGSPGPSATSARVSGPPGATTRPATTRPGANGSGPARFATVPAGAALPSGSQCAAWVRARPERENKAVNRGPNQVTGQRVDKSIFASADPRAARLLAPRVDGQFTGTTKQILRWAACKWGVDEDLVFAQAAIESWWRQDTKGDFAGDAAACPPGHALGADGRPGECPQSYGIMQTRYPYFKQAWPAAERSTAMNADMGYAVWRSCFEGYETWLNTVERGRDYGPGDVWGCFGRWFSGRWHTQAGAEYVARVRDYLTRRVWEERDFQQG